MFLKEQKEIDSLVYNDNPPKKFKKDESDKLFSDGWMDMDVPPPPANSSMVSKQEINEIIDRREMLTDFEKKVYINTNEDTSYYIKEFLEGQDLEFDIKDIERITDSVKHIGRYYKNKFNRPRPYQLAEALGMDKFTREKLETTNSPAYPSNHALQARVVAHYYGKKYPQYKKYLLKGADMSSEGRVNAGVHYPSDIHCAYQIADAVMEFFDFDLKEDAPMNATGGAISMPPTMQKKKKRMSNKNFEVLKRKI